MRRQSRLINWEIQRRLNAWIIAVHNTQKLSSWTATSSFLCVLLSINNLRAPSLPFSLSLSVSSMHEIFHCREAKKKHLSRAETWKIVKSLAFFSMCWRRPLSKWSEKCDAYFLLKFSYLLAIHLWIFWWGSSGQNEKFEKSAKN